jgi:UPF0716 protein FxsA
MFFIPLPLVLLEVIIFSTFVHFYGFWDVFLAYFFPCLLGAVLFSMIGRSMMMSLQRGLSQGEMPADSVLHRGAMMLGSVFLMIPMFITRVFAVFLILPILRHLAIFIFKTFIFKRLAKSNFTFVKMGGFGQSQGGFSTDGFQQEPRQERDVDAINVTPIEITHTKIEDKDDSKKES